LDASVRIAFRRRRMEASRFRAISRLFFILYQWAEPEEADCSLF
jgi:hypothetical protein